MKKKLYLLFGLAMSLLLVGIVKAEGPYFFDFEMSTTEGRTPGVNFEYNGGYLVVDYSNNATMITYDKTGKVLKTKDLTFDEFYIQPYKEYIYLIRFNDNNFYLEKYDSNLEKVKSAEMEAFELSETNWIGFDVLYIDDEQIVIPGAEKLEIYNLNLEHVDTLRSSNRNLEKYFPGYTVASDIMNSEKYDYIDAIQVKDGKIGVITWDEECIAPEEPNTILGTPAGFNSDSSTCTYELALRLFDEEGEEIWHVDLDTEKYGYGNQVVFLNEHIIAAVANGEETENYILIYDYEGNLVQTLNSGKSHFDYINKTTQGFIFTAAICMEIEDPAIEEPSIVEPSSHHTHSKDGNLYQKQGQIKCSGSHEVYYLKKAIKTVITEGKGNIEVAKEQKPGEPVTFTVTPDKGYVIGVIKVTDVDGNVITFTKDELKGNTFTMPTADVTIEVEFLVENAKTADIAITFIAVIAGFAGIMCLTNKKKLNKVA